MSLKLKEENKIILSFESLMEDDSIIFYELSLLVSNIKREIINVLNSFLSFLKKYENMKVHNMISLMLNPRFKSHHIVSSFVGREQVVALIEEYDRKSLYPMLVKCHEHLYPLVGLNRICVDQDIFEQIASTSELAEKLLKKGVVSFQEISIGC
jgi:hypothetical protein